MSWGRPSKWKQQMVIRLKARDGENCWLCALRLKEGDITIEHLIPRSLGGTDEESNLVLCHRPCNRHLADRPLERKLQMRDRWHLQARQILELRALARQRSKARQTAERQRRLNRTVATATEERPAS
jgi:5-methylcytosine-specific restriction endonuclease McrA